MGSALWSLISRRPGAALRSAAQRRKPYGIATLFDELLRISPEFNARSEPVARWRFAKSENLTSRKRRQPQYAAASGDQARQPRLCCLRLDLASSCGRSIIASMTSASAL